MPNVGDGTGHTGMPKGENATTVRPSKPMDGSKETRSFTNASGPALAKGGNRTSPLKGK